MENHELKKYLSDVLEREQALFTAHQIRNTIKQQIKQIPIVNKPTLPLRPTPVDPPPYSFFGIYTVQEQRYEKYVSDVKRYNKEMNIYYDQNKKYSESIKLKSLAKNLHEKVHDIETLIDESQAALEALYSLDVIFGKYRYFVAVASMCEYLESGRCYSLEGHEGAYNISTVSDSLQTV